MKRPLTSRFARAAQLTAVLMSFAVAGAGARADSPFDAAAIATQASTAAQPPGSAEALSSAFDNGIFDDVYALGIARYRVDGATKVTGWRINEGWYLGSQSGEDSGLTLVWQTGSDQMSLSKDGLRFTRRF